MSTATKGRGKEYRVRDHLAAHGWIPIMRASASRGPADLLMAHPWHGAALIQAKSACRLDPSERASLLGACELVGAIPLLAVVEARTPIRYYWLTEGPASEWGQWYPSAARAADNSVHIDQHGRSRRVSTVDSGGLT
jgi:hypothetical protein